MKFLVPIDYSNPSIYALKYAINLATRVNAKLYLVHVFQTISRADTMISLDEVIQQDHQQKLANILTTLKQEPAEVEIVVQKGDPANALFRLAVGKEVDLIILGAQGESRHPDISYGSTVGGLIKVSNVPLLIVPESAELQIPQNFLFAFRKLDHSAPDILLPLKKLALALKAKVRTLHVTVNAEDIEALSSQSMLGEVWVGAKELANGELPSGVAKSGEVYDVLCMIKRNRGFFEKIFTSSRFTKADVDIKTPFLLLPE